MSKDREQEHEQSIEDPSMEDPSDSDLSSGPSGDAIAEKIIQYYGYFEEYSLKQIAKTCVRLIISEHYKDLCYDNFKILSFDEMRTWVLEEIKQNFDDKIIPLIEQHYPDLDEDRFEEKVALMEALYEREHEEQLTSTTNAALKELKIRVKGLQKELKALKRKYTV